jgi:hypothetical protein
VASATALANMATAAVENGVGGALMSQMLPFADPGPVDLFLELETAVYAGR